MVDKSTDKFTGKVAYAVLSVGGFLGIRARYHPLPRKSLAYDSDPGGFVVDVTRDQLERAPTYEAADRPWSVTRFGRSVYDHYDIPWCQRPRVEQHSDVATKGRRIRQS